MNTVRILSPAKVNLGLSILGKRSDGYHEIDTIMAMVGFCDEITISPGDGFISISGMDDVPVESNLMTKAAKAWSNAAGRDPAWQIGIKKRIPSPAGIGGGSSNAASVLLGLNELHGSPLSHHELHKLAAGIGADCPFFLGAPCTRATGIGTDLRPLPEPSGWVVLAITSAENDAKTATLYGALTPEDYGDSERIDAIERQIRKRIFPSGKLDNSFERPALGTFTGLSDLRDLMIKVTGSSSLSGAGPALYATAPDRATAEQWTDQINGKEPGNTQVFTAPVLRHRPQPEILP